MKAGLVTLLLKLLQAAVVRRNGYSDGYEGGLK